VVTTIFRRDLPQSEPTSLINPAAQRAFFSVNLSNLSVYRRIMRILLTGASGLLGSTCVTLLCRNADLELTVLRTSQSECPLPLGAREVFTTDLTDRVTLQRELARRPPTHIIHTAALSQPARCEQEPDLAHLSNVLFTRMLCEYAEEVGAHITFVSTDLVFDGGAAPRLGFNEQDGTCPVSVYATTKVLGEQEVLVANPKNAVVRLSLLYGYSLSASRGVLGWMEDLWMRGESVPLFSDEFRTPIHIADAAYAILQVTEKSLAGVFHCGGPARLSRVEFGAQIADALGYDTGKIRPCLRADVTNLPHRPADVSLQSNKLFSLLPFTPRTVQDALTTSLDPRKSA
jgi:dTDP-4-dehydrorhamnose reductase